MLHSITYNSYIIISLRPSTYFMGSKVNLGLLPPAGYAVCDGNMSSSFFLSFFLATPRFHILPYIRF